MLPDIAGCTTYGIKGTMSASELSILRARMEGGRRNKALRGALYWRVAAGFVREGDTIRKDPDQHLQTAILEVFRIFRETGTARQAAARLRDMDVELPVRNHSSGMIEWQPASYERVLRILGNPAMGGAYAYGFRRGRPRDAPLRPVEEQWDVLLPERHEGYVSWQEWLDIKEQLARNHSFREAQFAYRRLDGRMVPDSRGRSGRWIMSGFGTGSRMLMS